MGIANWDHFVGQAYKVLQPGGFLELQELSIPLDSPDGSVTESTALWTWGQKVREACAKLSIDTMAATKLAERMKSQGFEKVNHVNLLCPLGPWAKGQREKRLGYMARKDLYEGIDAISKRLLILGGDSEDEVDAFLARCKEELLDPTVSRGFCNHDARVRVSCTGVCTDTRKDTCRAEFVSAASQCHGRACVNVEH